MTKPARRSPLKAKPLRNAGQSVQDEIDHLYDDVLTDHLVLLFAVFAVWAMALVTWLFPTPPFTFFVLMSMVFVGMLVWSVPKVVKARRKIRRLRLGRDGERAVAECLDLVRHDGAWVIHDLPGSGFNVDHVVIGTQGVFAIETKTWSKPTSGDPRIQFDERRWSVRFMYAVAAVFRRWPKTYVWDAEIELAAAPGPTMRSRWTRVGRG